MDEHILIYDKKSEKGMDIDIVDGRVIYDLITSEDF
jgi:hypothetical protein